MASDLNTIGLMPRLPGTSTAPALLVPAWVRERRSVFAVEAAALSADFVFGYGLGVAPGDGEPTVDDGPALQAMIDACAARGGGRVVCYRSHRIASEVIVRPNVELCYPAPPLANRIEGDVNRLTDAPALWFTPTGYLTVQHSIRNILCLPAGLTTLTDGNPGSGFFDATTMRAALTLGNGFASAGNPIRIAAAGGDSPRPEEITLTDVSGFGFATLVTSSGGTRMSFTRVWGDCNSLLDLEDSGGYVRITDCINRCYLTSGVTGVEDLYAPCVTASNVGGKLAVEIGATPDPTRAWATGVYVGQGEERYNGASIYRAFNSGVTGASAPVHTSGRVSDGGVTWAYKRPYTATRYTPDQLAAAAYGGTGFLAAGDPVYLTLAPADCPGGDVLDPEKRGRLIVNDIQTVGPTAATIVFEDAYDAGVAAAITTTTKLLVLPSARPGTALRTVDVDTCLINGFLSKGSRFGMRIDGSGHKIFGGNFEPGAQGENDAGEWGSVAIALESGAERFSMESSSVKSMGTLVRVDIGGRVPAKVVSTVLRNAEHRSIDMVSGAADMDVVFETRATVHSRSGASYLDLKHRGLVPAFSGDGSYMERIGTDTSAPKPNNKRRTRVIGGGRGVELSIGAAQEQWQASTVYALNALAWNTVAATGDQYLYRVTARVGAFTSGTVGPQGTTEGATETDGDLTWQCIGPYVGGWTGVRVDGASGTAQLRASATGADAPDVLCAETSATDGRGLYAARGLMVNGTTAVNPVNNKDWSAAWFDNTTLRFRLRGDDGTVRTFDLGPFA